MPKNIAKPTKLEIAGIKDGRDITRPFIGPLLYPLDTVLRSQNHDYKVYTALLRDSQVFSCIQQRIAKLIACETIVDAASDSDIDIAAADFLRSMLFEIGWDAVCERMLYAIFFGFSISEIQWAYRDGKHTIDRIDVRSQERFRFDTDLQPRLITSNNWQGEELPDRKFWWLTFGGHRSDEPYGLGLAHQLYWLVYFKRNGMKSWLKFLDRFGHPLPLVKYGANASDDEKKQALDIALSLAEDSAAAAPEGLVFELVETARSGTADYTQLVSLLDAGISKIILSQTMTTDSGSSRSQAEVHGSVADSIVKSDADLICESFNRTIAVWVTELNFPGAQPPRIYRKTQADQDLKAIADRDKVLFDMGYPPTAEYVVETFGEGFRPPEKGEASPIALNGAQVTALTTTISQAISDGWIPELAVATIRASFPTIGADLITAIAEQLQAQVDKSSELSKPQEAIVSPEQAAMQFAEMPEPIDEARFVLLQNLDRAVDAMVLKATEIESKQAIDFAIVDRAEKLLTADFAAKKAPKGKKNCEKGKICKGSCIAKAKTCLGDMNPAQLKAHKAAQASARKVKGGGGGAVAAATVGTPAAVPTIPIVVAPVASIVPPVVAAAAIARDSDGIPIKDPYDKSLSTFNALGVERSYAGVDQTAGNSRLFMARDIIKNGSQQDIDTFMKDQYLYHFEGVKNDGSKFSDRANYEFRTLWAKTSPSVRQELADEFKGKNPVFKKLSANDLEAAKVAKDKAAKAEEASYLAKKAEKAAKAAAKKATEPDGLDDLFGDAKPSSKPIDAKATPTPVPATKVVKKESSKDDVEVKRTSRNDGSPESFTVKGSSNLQIRTGTNHNPAWAQNDSGVTVSGNKSRDFDDYSYLAGKNIYSLKPNELKSFLEQVRREKEYNGIEEFRLGNINKTPFNSPVQEAVRQSRLKELRKLEKAGVISVIDNGNDTGLKIVANFDGNGKIRKASDAEIKTATPRLEAFKRREEQVMQVEAEHSSYFGLSKSDLKGIRSEETALAKKVQETEDRLYGRKNTKTATEAEYITKAEAWAKSQGFVNDGNGVNGFTAKQAAKHDIAHPATHDLVGLDSAGIHSYFGGLKTASGKKSLLGEEAIVNVMEHLSRGDTLESSVMSGTRVARMLSKNSTKEERAYVRSPKFLQDLNSLAEKSLRADNFGTISKVIRESNWESGTVTQAGNV